MSAMTINVELRDGGAVELQGTQARYWKGTGEADYVGRIDNLPTAVLRELENRGVIKSKKDLPGYFKWPKT